MQYTLWKEKSWVSRFTDGDRNTAYFHKMEKIWEAYMPITLLHQNNNVFSTFAEIEEHILS